MAKRFIGNVKGVSITAFSWEYYLSSSKTVLDGGSWSESPPTLGNNKYLWMRSKVTLSDSTIQYTTPVCEGVWEEIYGIYAEGEKIDGALEDITNLKSRMEAEEDKIQDIEHGGTGATTAAAARKAILESKALSIAEGGTGATTAAAAREKLDLSHVGAAASAKGAGSVSLSSAVITKVPLSVWNARTDTAFAFSDGGIKCPYDGVVEISGSVYVNTTSSGAHGCYVTCGDYDTSQFVDTGSGGAISSGRIIIPVSAGDVVYLKGRSSQASSVAASLSSTHLDIKYIK